jgi:hypothetical protein
MPVQHVPQNYLQIHLEINNNNDKLIIIIIK